jgi:inosose dehydratase
MTAFGEWCAEQGMPLAYHHHMAAVVETEEELDLFMATPARASRSSTTRGTWRWRGATCCASSTGTTRASAHVHTKDVRQAVIDGLDRTRESFLDAVVKGAFTVPGDGSLDFEAIVRGSRTRLRGLVRGGGRAGPPGRRRPSDLGQGQPELRRILALTGYEVVG